MMIKRHVWTISIVTSFWTLSVFQILILNVASFNLKCPAQAHWNLRANANCTNTLKYYCLFNYINETYVEGCNGPDWDRKGSKRIYAGYFTRGDCKQERFQPFKFWTNGSMSDCVYAKSICSEDGQNIYIDNSAKDDRTCRCDYKRNYAFVKIPRQLCYCIPAEEDCSCYIKSCPTNFTLSADYTCISNESSHEKLRCKDTIRYPKADEEKQVDIGAIDIYSEPRWNDTPEAVMLFALCFTSIFITVALSLAVLFLACASEKPDGINHTGFKIAPTWLGERLQSLKGYFKRDQTGSCETIVVSDADVTDAARTETDGNNHESSVDKTHDNGSVTARIERVDVHQPSKFVELPPDEENYLRMIHLLFRVVCPVFRTTFNHEIQPNKLRALLQKHKNKMATRYRKTEKIINNYQWNLLYTYYKGKVVSSDDYDISLMMYLLNTLADIDVGDLYAVKSDKRVSAMLSRIKYIRKKVIQSSDGKLSKDHFNTYWDDIGEAILKLVSQNGITDARTDDEEKKQLICRIMTMNHVDLDNDKLCTYIALSETYAVEILHQIILEYCKKNKQNKEDILNIAKHELYHKRIVAELCCCVCNETFSHYYKLISEKQWEALYEIIKDNESHSCSCISKKCSKKFIPKNIDTWDLSLTMPLVLYISDILKYFASGLYKNKFDTFLAKNQHTIYHSLEKKRCCKCNTVPNGKTILIEKEWSKLFKKEDTISCQTKNENCCCQFSLKNESKLPDIMDMDEDLLCKLFHVVGPISILNKIGHDAFLYFLNWTVDSEPLQHALRELSNIIQDEKVRHTISQRLLNSNQSNDINLGKNDSRRWVSRHLGHQKITTEPHLQILVHDEDGYNVKSVPIHADFPLPNRFRKKIKDITTEENNFLVVVHGLTKIIYPVIKNELEKCPDKELDKILGDISEEQKVIMSNGSKKKGENRNRKEKLYLNQEQQKQLFIPKQELLKNLDIELMVYILKRRAKDDKLENYDKQLDVLDNIRREIMLSSSGLLTETRFQEIMKSITEAVVYLGGETYEEKVSNLQKIKIF